MTNKHRNWAREKIERKPWKMDKPSLQTDVERSQIKFIYLFHWTFVNTCGLDIVLVTGLPLDYIIQFLQGKVPQIRKKHTHRLLYQDRQTDKQTNRQFLGSWIRQDVVPTRSRLDLFKEIKCHESVYCLFFSRKEERNAILQFTYMWRSV